MPSRYYGPGRAAAKAARELDADRHRQSVVAWIRRDHLSIHNPDVVKLMAKAGIRPEDLRPPVIPQEAHDDSSPTARGTLTITGSGDPPRQHSQSRFAPLVEQCRQLAIEQPGVWWVLDGYYSESERQSLRRRGLGVKSQRCLPGVQGNWLNLWVQASPEGG